MPSTLDPNELRMPKSLPLWPREDAITRFNMALLRDFKFFHDPLPYDDSKLAESTANGENKEQSNNGGHHYCEPKGVSRIITHFLENTNHGSLLVTGYRGVGKTSAVNLALKEYVNACNNFDCDKVKEINIPVIMHLDLSSVTSAHDLLLLLFEVLNDKLNEAGWWSPDDRIDFADVETPKRPSFKRHDQLTKKKIEINKTVEAFGNRLCLPVNNVQPSFLNLKLGISFEELQKIGSECFPHEPSSQQQTVGGKKDEGGQLDHATEDKWADQLFPWIDQKHHSYPRLQELKRFLREECLEKLRRDIGYEKVTESEEKAASSSAWFEGESRSSGSHVPERHLSLYQYRFRDFLSKLSELELYCAVPSAHEVSQTSEQTGTTQNMLDVANSVQPCGANLEEEPKIEPSKKGLLRGLSTWLGIAENTRITLQPEKEAPDLYQPEESKIQEQQLASAKWLRARLKIVFIIDELDKLPVQIRDRLPDQTEEDRFHEVQRVVADLKFLLTEGKSHQIFIAGKDVEDAWHTDRNKREGLFESIFPRNIYIGTLFTSDIAPRTITKSQKDLLTNLQPGGYAEAKTDEEYDALYWTHVANACGITKNSLSYRTALLILPYLAPVELDALLLTRVDAKDRSLHSSEGIKAHRNHITRLRILIHHLTYKGRGIPRKILREFYSYIQDRRVVGELSLCNFSELSAKQKSGICNDLILSLRANDLQRMGFYSRIMDLLEQNFDRFRTLSDKGCISIFYLIDHILKFYETGFTTHEITGSEVSSTRQEMFPTQWLASEVVSILDGHLLRRRSLRATEFYLLPHAKHDLRKLVRNYPGEQVELRFAEADFEQELKMLEAKLKLVNQTFPNQRIESVQSQVRQGIIYERLGKLFDARLAYAKAVRWLRHDLAGFVYTASGANESPESKRTVIREFRQTFTSLIVQVLHRLGRIYEEENELQSAMRCYEEALSLHELGLKKTEPEHADKRQVPSWPSKLKPEHTWPYEPYCSNEAKIAGGKTFGEFMLLKKDLLDATLYIHDQPRYSEDVRPMARDNEIQGFATTLNHAALAHEKLWERSSANGYLLRALNYLHYLQDEFGVVEQMFLIGTLMVRRRDLKLAALWYLRALELEADLREQHQSSQLPNDKKPNNQPFSDIASGIGWSVIGFPSDLHATLLMYLGDICQATGDWGLPPHSFKVVVVEPATNAQKRGPEVAHNEHNSQFRKHVRARLLALFMRDAAAKMSEKSYQEKPLVMATYLFDRSLHLFEAGGHASGSQDVLSRQLLLHSEYLTQGIGEVYSIFRCLESEGINKGKSKGRIQSGKKKHSLHNAKQCKVVLPQHWDHFWETAGRMVYSLLDTNPSRFREKTTIWGHVQDRRRLGQVFRSCMEILKEFGLLLMSRRQLSPTEKGSDTQTESYVWDYSSAASSTSQQEFIIQSSYFTDFFKSSKADEKSFKMTLNLEMLPSVFGPMLGAGVNAHFPFEEGSSAISSFGGIDSQHTWPNAKDDGKDAWLVEEALTRIALDSSSSLAVSTNQANAGQDLSSDQKHRVHLMRLAEWSGITAYLLQRDAIEDSRLGRTCLTLGQLYSVVLCSVCRHTRYSNNGWNQRNAESAARLYLHAKRFLVKALAVFNEEPTKERILRPHISETYFCLGDLALLRALCADSILSKDKPMCSQSSASDDLKAIFGEEGSKTMKCLTDEFKKLEKHVGDIDFDDTRRQVHEYYSKGTRVVGLELDDFLGRYPLAPDVFYSHMNISDPVLHSEICRSVQMRHVWGAQLLNVTQLENSSTQQSVYELRKEIVEAMETPRIPGGDWKTWLKSIEEMLQTVTKVRTDRPMFEISTDERSMHLGWVESFPERYSLSYFW
ncbi:MAG: tetratricopeptide repeat protein [Verrucomicrobia bacterium]|nr:tetratricopeptide repeat protein [Verrucomicrobiota bacterium]